MSTGGGGNNSVEKSPLLSSSLSERPRTVRMEGAPPAATTMNRNVADRASAVLELEEDDRHQGGPSSLGASTTQQQQSHSINSSHQKNAKKMPASAEAYQEQPPPPYSLNQPMNVPPLYPQQLNPFDAHSPPSNHPTGQFFGDGQNSAEMHHHQQQQESETFDGSEDTPANAGGPTVTCRVCEADIPLEGKTNQHVIRCNLCHEVTPIRAAPPGKKYVRCPCNCLLVCKATSTRIACPRQNCRRVITLASGPPNSSVPGTAIRAPVGTCRVQCAYCQEIFMFNTLTNQLAICPHCRKSSSVGVQHARTRSLLFFLLLMLTTILLIALFVAISNGQNGFFMWIFLIALLAGCGFFGYRFTFYWRIKVSQILGPL